MKGGEIKQREDAGTAPLFAFSSFHDLRVLLRPTRKQDPKQQQPTPNICAHQEVFLYVFVSVLAELSGKIRMGQEITYLISAAVHRMYQCSR